MGEKIPHKLDPTGISAETIDTEKSIILSRRDVVKLGIGVAAAAIGYYSFRLLTEPKNPSRRVTEIVPPGNLTTPSQTEQQTETPGPEQEETPKEEQPSETSNVPAYYQIYLENGKAKALNVKTNSIDFQDSDHHSVIQSSLDALPSRDTKLKVSCTGDFTSTDTIKIPSFTIFEVDGSITLAPNTPKVLVQESNPLTGTTQIEMIGGIYDGNKNNQQNINPIIGFTRVTQSHFANITVQNGTKGFVLDTNCSNNVCDKLIAKNNLGAGTLSSGNGLGDRGDHNTWNDCVADGSSSDNWIVKCRDSIFNRCIGSNSLNAVGFGLFGDVDITGNQLNACEAFGNKTNGVSLNIPTESNGKSIKLVSNSIQGMFHNNQEDGVRLTNVTSDGTMQDNIFDILAYNNGKDGFDSQQQAIVGNSGTIVAYGNIEYDVYVKGSSNVFSVYLQGNGRVNATSGNTITKSGISCLASPSWAVNKYCNPDIKI